MIKSSRGSSGRRKLGPVGWVSLFILVVASGTLLYYISEGGLGSTERATDAGTVHTAQSSPAPPAADSPSRSSEPSTSPRANYTREPASSPGSNPTLDPNAPESSGSSESPRRSEPAASTSSPSARGDQSFPDYSQATRLINIFDGESSGRTPSFEVSDVWTLEWEARGSIFQVFVQDESGDLHTIAVNNSGMGPGGHSGKVELETPGTYRLKINALSRWRIRIVQGK